MIARISGRMNDLRKINESGWLMGEHNRGVLASSIALRDDAVDMIIQGMLRKK